MKVLVIGANGNTGRRVISRLKDSHHDPVAMIRHPDHRDTFDKLGVATVLADLEYPVDHALRGCDAVVFAAGSGAKTGKDKTVIVDFLGAIRTMVSAQVLGVNRYLMLSSLNADVESTSSIAHYHRAKGHADNHLRSTDLDYTIVCPGRLTDDEGTGTVSIREELSGKGRTSRENLAQVLVACLDSPNTIKKSFAVLDGDTPVADALDSI